MSAVHIVKQLELQNTKISSLNKSILTSKTCSRVMYSMFIKMKMALLCQT